MTELMKAVQHTERQLIEVALRASGNNVTQAAAALGEDRGNLYRRLRRLGIRIVRPGYVVGE